MNQQDRIHFIGIGGIGMSGIAQILLHSGYQVQGSDLQQNKETEKLAEMGATIFEGHSKENVKSANVIVYSSAIDAKNPELAEAKSQGLPILSRAQMLAELMHKKRTIVVAGAHGKTTTSALVASMMMESRFDPTAVIGGRLRSIASNAKMGTDEYFVAESDESDGSFLRMLPLIAVITNLDEEHLSHYGSYENLEKAFVDFANRVPFDGRVILCVDDQRAKAILPKIEKNIVTYGVSDEADIQARDIALTKNGASFDVLCEKEPFGHFEVALFGMHNVRNALAAVAVGIEIGMNADEIKSGLKHFSGIDRRLEWKGKTYGIQVLDDYAHHPTEIRSTIQALKTIAGKMGAVRVLFQPHRYTRLRDLWNEFIAVFDDVDELVLLPVYAASEEKISGINSKALAEEIKKRETARVKYASDLDEGADMICHDAVGGDVLVTMGAGNVYKAADRILSHCSAMENSGGVG